MAKSLEEYIGIPYRKANSPVVKDDINTGINCQYLVHLVYADVLGVSLPDDMLSKEIYEDVELFATVTEGDFLFGDIFLFGNRNPKNFHLALFTGIDNDGCALLLHANMYDGVSLWRLADFWKFERYGNLQAIRRLREREPLL